MQIKMIVKRLLSNGKFEFGVTLRGRNGTELEVWIPAKHLMVFAHFQNAVLEQHGVLYNHDAATGGFRGKEAWVCEVSRALRAGE